MTSFPRALLGLLEGGTAPVPRAAPFCREKNQDPEPKRFAWGAQRAPSQQECTTWGSWFPATSLAVGMGTGLNTISQRPTDHKAAKKGCCPGISGGDEWEQGLWLQTVEGKGIYPETVLERGRAPRRQDPGGEKTLNFIDWCLVLNTKL